ncbi:uncharacterized protein LY79DRAFT_527367 [Colletotrichum navitas]|uniref:Uncharacterized protein n=1 Tax=Colletotrichum navitas TaxID=681940 RepID=A0AAD8UYW6_9PEZI|nr:uncharacterized protein LY79DRAFT_527367 [Colletotrichum navitas]KAK1570152.1 hypothetical protein LY79DRAFT_527367 [Colletotrichum navitas]
MSLLPADRHPRDHFTALRFSTRIPRLCPEHNNNNNAQHEATYNLTQLQPIELCFHRDFVADPDDPVSLHLAGHPRRIIQYHGPIKLPLPTPPCPIHKIDDVVQLTLSNNKSSYPPTSSPSPNPSLSLSPILSPILSPTQQRRRPNLVAFSRPSLAFFIFCGFLLGLWTSQLFRHSHVNSCTTAMTAPDGTLYEMHFENNAIPLELYRAIALLEHQRLSLYNVVIDTLNSPNATFLQDVQKVVGRICLNATYLLSQESRKSQAATASHRHDISFTCRLLDRHISTVALLWAPLSETVSAWRPDRRLRMAAKLLGTAYDTPSFLYTYRKAFLNSETDWADATCHFCSSAGNTQNGTIGMAWHFACDPAFVALSDVSSLVSFLESWGQQQSARRYKALHKAFIERQGGGPDENNYGAEGGDIVRFLLQASDVAAPSMAAEGELMSLLRQVVELLTGISDLTRLVSQHMFRIAAMTDAADGGLLGRNKEYTAAAPPPPWFQDAFLWLRPSQVPSHSPDVSMNNIYKDVIELNRLQDSTIKLILHTLAPAATDIIPICNMASDFKVLLDLLDDGHGWNAVTSHVVAGSESKPLSIIHVTNTTYVMNIDREVAALEAEAARLKPISRQRRPPPDTEFGDEGENGPRAPVEVPEPQDNEERQFLERVRQGSQAMRQAAVQRLMGVFGQETPAPSVSTVSTRMRIG